MNGSESLAISSRVKKTAGTSFCETVCVVAGLKEISTKRSSNESFSVAAAAYERDAAAKSLEGLIGGGKEGEE